MCYTVQCIYISWIAETAHCVINLYTHGKNVIFIPIAMLMHHVEQCVFHEISDQDTSTVQSST